MRREVESLLAPLRASNPPLATGGAADAAAAKPLMTPSGAQATLVGRRLGPYEIVSVLGQGGMGVVYRGLDTRLRRAVAVKVLPRAFEQDPDRLRRFTNEARAASALNHPHPHDLRHRRGRAGEGGVGPPVEVRPDDTVVVRHRTGPTRRRAVAR